MKLGQRDIFDYIDVEGGLDIVKANFQGVEQLSWQELFDGFDELHAITYSSAVGFIYELVEKFDYSEIIFGYEGVLSYSLHEILAYQQLALKRIKEEAGKIKLNLLERVDQGNLKIYLAREKISHEKIYLLKSKSGRKRVITGSANMSYSAFTGRQRENITYMDGDRAYDWYMGSYLSLRDASTDSISRRALVIEDEDQLLHLPISETLKVNKSLVVEAASPEEQEEVRFILDVNKLSNEFRNFVPKSDSKGRTLLSPESIISMQRRYETSKSRARVEREEFPQLDLDFDGGRVVLNGQELDLRPSEEEVKEDVELFLEYMSGYEKYHLGDINKLQRDYYRFALWFLTSPFMAPMRDVALQYNHNLLPYPVFGIIYGNSKAGKTTLLETLLKMMVGQGTRIEAVDFTRRNIYGLKAQVRGVPIIVDDINQARFRGHAVELIKADYFGSGELNTSYPAVAITANEDVKALSPEVIRRTVICHVDVKIKNTDMMKLSTVQRVQNNIGTALYRRFLGEMMEAVPGLINELKDENRSGIVDILEVSSGIFYGILEEFKGNEELPSYIRPLNLEHYFGERITGEKSLRALREALVVNREAFEVDRKKSKLIYNAKETWEANNLRSELPEDLDVRVSRELVIMDLEKAKEYLGVNRIAGSGIMDRLKDVFTSRS